jgi:hypothetical protein
MPPSQLLPEQRLEAVLEAVAGLPLPLTQSTFL